MADPTLQPVTRSIRPRWPALLLAVAFLWAVYARSIGVFTDFWFDEVWSWTMARSLHSPWQVFTLHRDNNHYLNTLWMYLVGNQAAWPIYRIPAVLTGLGTIALLTRIGLRRGRVAGVTAGLLGATSYLFLLYSTEARGYGPALFFSMLCVDLLQRDLEQPRPLWAWAFSASAVIGLLSHLSFLFPYLGLMAWSALAQWRRTRSPVAVLKRELQFQAIPLAALCAIYVVDVRHLRYGGGTAFAPWTMAREALAYAFGWPSGPIGTFVALGGAALVYVLWRSWRSADPMGCFYAIGIVFAPAAIIAVTHPTFFFPRYFLACVPVFILLLGDLAEDVWRWRPGRLAAIGVIGAICVGNIALSVQFFRDGRGHFLDALTDIAKSTIGGEVTMGTNYDLHLDLLSQYYVPQLAVAKAFSALPREQWTAQSPDWLVMEYYDEKAPARRIHTDAGGSYRLVRDYPFSAKLSGAGWRIYRRVPQG